MASRDIPVTGAVRFLKDKKVDFIPHLYDYEEKGGTAQTAKELNVSEHNVVKTLVLENESGKGLIVLMHGDFEISLKELARLLNVKSVKTCDAQKSLKLTGYQFGGTSPFGTKSILPVYIESTILELDKIYINGGKRGFILEMEPMLIIELLNPEEVKVAIRKN